MKKLLLILWLLIGSLAVQSQSAVLNGVVSSQQGYNSAAAAFFTAAGITSSTEKTAVNYLVNSLQGSNALAFNYWNITYAVYPYVGGTPTSASYNLKNTAQYQITWTGGVSFTNAIKFNGTTGGGDTGLNCLSVFGMNSPSFHTYVITQTNTGMFMAAGSNNYDWSANSFVINTATAGTSVSINKTGMSSVIRIDASNVKRIIGGTDNTAISSTATVNANASFLIGRHSSGLYSDGLFGFSAIMNNLTAAQVATLNDIVYTYNQMLGRALPQNAWFYGDSITATPAACGSTTPWSTQFCTAKGLTPINMAVSGTPLEDATPNITNNLYSNYTTWIKPKRAQDKYTFIAHAVNDTGFNNGNFTTTLFNTESNTILAYLFANGWSTSNVFWVSGFYEDAWATPWGGIAVTPADATRYNSFLSQITTICSNNGITSIVVSYTTAETCDNLHPNNPGSTVISNTVAGIVP